MISNQAQPMSSGVDSETVPRPVLGCVADDITGASDLADALVQAGLDTVQVFGARSPNDRLFPACDAVVVALKSRTCPVDEAITQSVDTARWLRAGGIGHTFFKYCSTFDSTPAGNIGPVADALADLHNPVEPVVHCPAYPINQRTLYQGHLFVGSALLSESGMKDHPLTPMRDANLVRVLAQQTTWSVGLVPLATVRKGPAAIAARLEELGAHDVRHALVDALVDQDLDAPADAVRDAPVAAGGAAFGAAWGAAIAPRSAATHRKPVAPAGREAVLVGSASTATATQVAAFEARWPVRRLDAATLAGGAVQVQAALDWAREHLQHGPVMIASDTRAHAIAETRSRFGAGNAAAVVESTLAQLAIGLHDLGVRRLVVAGGETSGAVASALGLTSVQVGPQICPGVPWTVSADPDVAIAFKSGNFGPPDFFADAFASFETDHWRHE